MSNFDKINVNPLSDNYVYFPELQKDKSTTLQEFSDKQLVCCMIQ